MALPTEALEILQRLSASNEGRLPDKLALLERRLTVPPSPAVSGQGGSALLTRENSIHSVTQAGVAAATREGTPSISNSQLPQAGRSLDGLDPAAEQASKRRRIAVGAQAAAGSRGASPSGAAGAAQQQRPSLSPFLSEGGAAAAPRQQQQQQEPTPGSSKKQKNTISRYFPQLSGGGGAVAGGGGAATAAAPPRPSPAPSDPQAAPPVPAMLQTLQAEAQRLR